MTGGWGCNAGVSVQTEAGMSLCLVGHGEQLRLYFQCPATQPDACFKKITWAALWLWAEGAGQEWEQGAQLGGPCRSQGERGGGSA